MPLALAETPARRRGYWWYTGGFALGATCLALCLGAANDDAVEERAIWLPPRVPMIAVEPPRAPAVAEPDPRHDEEQALIAELARDAWIHRPVGPSRRMPINPYGAFGATREGERPPECLSGHCGVDLGRVWGDPVHAVHDGTVEWVDRGPNEDHGGIFVKPAHRDGTLFG